MLDWFRPVSLSVAACLSFAGPALAQEADFVHECDTYAAHPDDRNRWASGVADDDIIPGPAVKFCSDAVAAHPETPRFHFQLGRALWAAQRYADGNEVFMALQESHDYPPAYAYLGAAFAMGLGGIEVDEDLALELYEVAAASGFAPAIEALGDAPEPAMNPSVAPAVTTAPPQVASAAVSQAAPAPAPPADVPLNLTGYAHPRVIQALDNGDLAALQSVGLGTVRFLGVAISKLDVYLAGFDEEFSGTLNFKDPACVQIHNPRVTQLLERRLIMTATGGGTVEGAAANAFSMLLGTVQQMQSGNMMGMVDQQREVELVRVEGQRDAAKLILGYGCLNKSVSRIYSNLAASVLNAPPLMSEEQKRRQAAAAAKEQQEREAEKVRRAAAQERDRQRALRTSANDACFRQYDDPAFCTCLLAGLEPMELDDAAWQSIGGSFDRIVALRTQYSTIPDVIRECRRQVATR